MRLSHIYALLMESKLDDLLSKSSIPTPGKEITKQIYTKLTNQSKYAKYLIDYYEELKYHTPEVIIDILNTFEKNLQRIQNKDIYSYSPNQLIDLITTLKETQSKSQLDKLGPSEVEKVLENDRVLIVVPKTYEASKKYGKGTKWCISSEDDPEPWLNYTEEDLHKFYFIIDKKRKPYDPETKEGDVLYKVAVRPGTRRS